jgi:restriction system protein
MTIWNYASVGDLNRLYSILFGTPVCFYCNLRMLGGFRSDYVSGRSWGSDIDYCKACGWWRLKTTFVGEEIGGEGSGVNVNEVCTKCATGILKSLDVADLNTPLHEIKQYLMMKESRIGQVAPRTVERLVADVFRGLGYNCELTGASRDGGIDLFIMEKASGSLSAVQVKRRKHKTEVSQVRSFLGAMAPKRISEGVFVSTGGFTRDSMQYVQELKKADVAQIILRDAEWLLGQLCITKRDEYEGVYDGDAPFSVLLKHPEKIEWGFNSIE